MARGAAPNPMIARVREDGFFISFILPQAGDRTAR
jgi:hypothetical protein